MSFFCLACLACVAFLNLQCFKKWTFFTFPYPTFSDFSGFECYSLLLIFDVAVQDSVLYTVAPIWSALFSSYFLLFCLVRSNLFLCIFCPHRHIYTVLSLYLMMVFQVFRNLFTILYIYKIFYFASLKLLTNFENTYLLYRPQNSFLCDWSMFSGAVLSLAAGKMRKN